MGPLRHSRLLIPGVQYNQKGADSRLAGVRIALSAGTSQTKGEDGKLGSRCTHGHHKYGCQLRQPSVMGGVGIKTSYRDISISLLRDAAYPSPTSARRSQARWRPSAATRHSDLLAGSDFRWRMLGLKLYGDCLEDRHRMRDSDFQICCGPTSDIVVQGNHPRPRSQACAQRIQAPIGVNIDAIGPIKKTQPFRVALRPACTQVRNVYQLSSANPPFIACFAIPPSPMQI